MLLGASGASMLGNMFNGKGVMRATKCVVRAGRRYNKMDHMDKKKFRDY